MKIISAVYKIMNEVTGDFYIGSSRNVKQRWAVHKAPSTWKNRPNSLMYQDMQKYGVDKFRFQILVPVMPEYLTQVEQEYIEMMKPIYNDRNANGFNTEKRKKHQIEYYQQNREKQIEHQIEYYQQNREKRIEYQIEYYQQNHEKRIEYQNKYNNKLCSYNGETLTLNALRQRFQKSGIEYPTKEAKKYLVL